MAVIANAAGAGVMGGDLSCADLRVTGRLNPISAIFEPGTMTAICGPNGAGKSTLLAALAGLLAPSSGQVLLGERDLAAISPRERARSIGFLPQIGEVAWDMTVRSLVALGRLPHGDRAAAPVDAALDAVDLAELADRMVSTLSGGERARALLARVLAGQPQWILADEPLAALDLAHQLSLLAHLRQAADGGGGVIMVLHDLPLAINHVDRVLLLQRGDLVMDGPAEQALSEPRIEQVWGVDARWLGGPGKWALATRLPS